MSRARRQQYMLRTEASEQEARRWETAKGTERFFKTGSRLWKLRRSLLQPGDRT